jgi:hypothetical protein
MRTTEHILKRCRQAVWMVGLGLSIGCGLGSLVTTRPPRIIPVGVTYLPHLVKGSRPSFPSNRVLVLLPVDKREAYPVKRGGALPATQDNTAILGIWGLNSAEGAVRVNSTQLGAQRRMKAGVPQDPDMPRGIFTLPSLERLVQDALESHFHEAGFSVQKASSPILNELSATTEPAHYAVGCAIEEFSLVSLLRYNEVWIYSALHPHTIDVPIRGPTRANVTLELTLYRWPSGEVLWQGKVADSVDDPPLGESEFLYSSPGEVMSMALSRAVGSILVTQNLQEVLLASPHQRSPG